MRPPEEPAQPGYAYQEVAKKIEAQILRGELKPGDQLPGETEMGSLFGVTRSTVREGLRQLESDGLIQRPSPRRMEVTVPPTDLLTSRATRAMALMKVTFRELVEVAMVMEPLAARMAAERASADEIDNLQQVHAELVSAEGQLERTIWLDEKFHAGFTEIGHNRVLGLAREPVGLLLFRGFEHIAPVATNFYKRQIEAHSNIVAAIRDRDPDRSEKWARMHIQDFWRGVQLAGLEESNPVLPRPGSEAEPRT